MKKELLAFLMLFTSILAFGQPANDNCTGAITLTVSTTCSYINYTCASATATTSPATPPAPGCASYSGGDVWFKVVVPASGHLIIDTQTGDVTDGGMAIYSGTCGSLVLIECDDDDSGNGMMPRIDNSSLTPGSTIYIRFWEYGNDNLGTFGICVTEPAPSSSNALCSGADPFCTSNAYNFPANTNSGTAQTGPDYGCLGSEPNPVWYYLKIATAGTLNINISSTCGDVDYAAWGPFSTLTCSNSDLTTSGTFNYEDYGIETTWEVDALASPSGNMVDCSYDISSAEVLTIPSAVVGKYYLVMITNYANCTGNILFNQTSGAGSTDCSIIAPPVTNNGPLCTGQTLQLTVTSPVAGASYLWSGPGTWTSTLMNPTIPNVTLANAGVYSLVITVGGVSSAPVTTTVVITALPTANISYSGSPWCKSAGVQSVTLTGTGPYTGGTYTSTAGLTINSTTGQITPSTSTAGTYTVTYTTPGSTCTATATTTVTITNPPTAAISYSGSPWCTSAGTQAVTLTGTNAYTGGTYTAAPGGLTLDAATGQITPSTSTAGTYTVTYTIAAAGGCSAVNATATVTVNTIDNPAFNYTPATMCQTGTDQSAVITGGATGTFTASPAGLVFLNASTGLIDVSASALNSYTITFTTNGACPANSTLAVNITSAPDATFSYAGPYCSNGTDPAPTFPAGATAGTFSANPSGLVFVSTTTGQIDVSASAGGTYTVTNNVAASGGCAAATATSTVTITELPTAVLSYSGSPWCTSTGAQAATLTGTGAYTGGTFISSPVGLTLDAATGQITPSTSLSGTYTVTYTIAAVGGCSVVLATTSVTITALPTATIAYSGSPWCTSAGVQAVNLTGANSYTGGTYTATPAGLTINATTGQITPATSTPGTYTVTYTIAATGGCAQVTATTSVTITALPTAVISYTGSPWCNSAGVQSASLSGSGAYTGGTFTSTTGLTLDATTGQITPSTSTGGIYTVTYTAPASGGCPAVPATTNVTITALPTATISYSGSPWCTSSGTQAVSLAGTNNFTGGSYSSTSGLSISSTTGQITPATSTPGTYTVTYTIAATGGCAQVTATTSVTITALPTAVISYTGSPWCNSAGVQSASLSGSGAYTGGTFTSTIGLTLDATTGQITPSTSTGGIYTVTYTAPASGGCPAVPATTNVTITALPTATIAYSGSPWCTSSGTQAVSLAGTNNFTGGSYSSTSGLSISSTTGQITPATSTPGTYTVTYTIAATGGCAQVTATTSVTITALPTAVISYTGSPWCNSAGVQSASLSGSGAYTGGTFTSTIGLTLDATTGQITPSTSTGGIYTVTYTSPASGGCPAVPATTNVTITTMPTANIVNLTGSNLLTCTTTAINVNATGSSIYTWDGGSTPNSASNSFTTPGTYTVTVSSANGCTGTNSITISQDATLPSVLITNITGSTVLNCITNVVNVTTAGGNTYHWDGGSTPATASNSFTLPGTYTVTATSTNGCTATSSITITQVEPVVLSLVSVSPDHCAQGIGEATVFAVGGSGSYTYTWDGTPLGASVNNLFAGTYQVVASDGQCNDMIAVVVGNVSGPTAVFEPVPDTMFSSNPVFSFHNGSSNASTYLWSFGDGNSSTVESPTHHYYGEGRGFAVSLEVTDSYGCKDTVSKVVTIIEDLNIWIPNSFTPNGDGINDVFKPSGVGYSLKGYELTIYDRYGKQQFYSNEFDKGWDGRIDGKKLNINNVFSYRIVIYDLKGKDNVYTGRVTLLGSKAAGN